MPVFDLIFPCFFPSLSLYLGWAETQERMGVESFEFGG